VKDDGLLSKKVDWMSGEIWMLENIIRMKCRSGRKKLPIVQRVTNLRFICLIERKNGWSVWWKTTCTKGENGMNEMQFKRWWKKVFAKDEPISNEWKLLDGRNIQLKDWRKQIRKKRNCQSRRLYTLKKLYLIARKNTAGVKLRSLKRWRDLLEWCGKFNWESGCHYYFKKWKHIKWKVGIMQEW